MAKKQVKKIKKVEEQRDDVVVDITKKLWAVFGILLFLLLFYLLAIHITNKNSAGEETSKADDTSSEVSISYDNIILGRSLDMSTDDYFVICYDYSDEEINTTFSSLVSSYRSKEDGLNIYSVDMSSSFNKKYVGEEVNPTPKSVSDMVINGPTLMKISNNEVVEYIQGQSEIEDYLS